MPQENLFSAFKDFSLEDWKSVIMKDLKGADYETLITDTPEGISIAPIYHGHDQSIHNFLNPVQLDNDALPIRHWVNNYTIKVIEEQKANTEALEALNMGADGLIFQLDRKVDFSKLLKDIQPAYCSISFTTNKPSKALIEDYFSYLKESGQVLEAISGNYLADGLELRDSGKYQLEKDYFTDLATIIRLAEEAPQFKCLHISGLLYQNTGANNVNELAFLLSKTAEYFDQLTRAGLSINTISKSLVFSVAFGSHYFFEIAKAKVLRKQLQRIFQAYDYAIEASAVKLIGYTSKRTKSALDYHVNLLRNTTETMAAILAGCNELYVAPHDEAITNNSRSTFKRTALNMSNLLKEEAHLDKIADPTLGSYYLDHIMDALAEKSWDSFLALEKQASYSELFQDGFVKQTINKDDQQSADALLSRKTIAIGANMYQNIGEKLSLEITKADDSNFLHPKRVGWKVENLRARTENFVNKEGENSRPTATIISLGTDAISKAKSDFAYSFLGMAGIKIAEEISLKDFERLSTILTDIKTDLIIYCYNEAPAFQKQHFQHSGAQVMIAGQEKSEADWKELGLYACINRKVAAYDFLQNLLNDLKIAE